MVGLLVLVQPIGVRIPVSELCLIHSYNPQKEQKCLGVLFLIVTFGRGRQGPMDFMPKKIAR